ncbi:MAG: ribosome maturation factor RimM [Clostridiaceae bacterium]|nr:ribosome maturation factor RimM [Eubacteriales bacterium]
MKNASEYLRVGLILRPHGVKGTVKLLPLTDDVSRFSSLWEAFLERKEGYESVSVRCESVRGDKEVYLSIEGVGTREDAALLRDVYLCVDRAHALKLPAGRYFVADIVGCEVFGTDGAFYGKVEAVLQNGAADVYVVRGEKTLMFPVLKKLLSAVDVNEKKIVLVSSVLEEVGLFEN